MISPLRRGGLAAARLRTPRASRKVSLGVLPLESRALLSTLSAVEPSADEQYMLQLVNRARSDPQAEAQRLLALARTDPSLRSATTSYDSAAFLREVGGYGPMPPLAFNPRLVAAARDHDARMLADNAQEHAPSGFLVRPPSPDLAAPDGQPYYPAAGLSWSTAENVFAYSRNLPDSHGKPLVDYFHGGFLLDWGNPTFGHLRNLFSPGPGEASALGRAPMSEIGIGILTDARPTTPPPANPAMPANKGLDVGPALVTQELGWRSGHQFLTGAIYADADSDNFYTPGEGLSGVRVEAVGRNGEGTFAAVTWGSGGYTLDLPAGTYDVTASGGGLDSPRSATITIGKDNVGWDIVLAGPAAPPNVGAPPQTSSPDLPSRPATPAPTNPNQDDHPESTTSGKESTAAVAKKPARAPRRAARHPRPPKLPRHWARIANAQTASRPVK